LAKISATIIKVTTDLKISPMPSKNTLKEAKTNFKFLVLINSNSIPANKLSSMAVVVSMVSLIGKMANTPEKVSNNISGKTGNKA
jgi:hypothetical protein